MKPTEWPTEQVTISKLKVDQQLAEAEAKGEWRMTTNAYWFSSGGHENVLELDCGDGNRTL